MSMSISERMAMQARAAAASHVRPAPAPRPAATVSEASRLARQASVASADSARSGVQQSQGDRVAVMSAAERIARQGAVAQQNRIDAARMPLPPEPKAAATMSAEERIRKQAIVAAAQKNIDGKASVTDRVLADIRARYQVFLANLDKELSTMDPLFFMPNPAPEEKVEEVADKVNGISTAEGEMVVEAEPSEPVPGMPFQATPVITTGPKRKPRRKKAADEAEEAAG